MSCTHTERLDTADWTEPTPDSPDGCADCLAAGESVWAHLRICLDCGHVACCDSSPHRHAAVHARDTGHVVIRSFEPGESWRWCFLDESVV
ncbi:MAG TPA: UBP-type zinc finger domain-containing protein [Pseudonocardia sp.]